MQGQSVRNRKRAHNRLLPCCALFFVKNASKPVSRVLSFKTAIYLDAPLPVRSSRLPGTAGPACMSLHGVAPDRVYSDGHFYAPSGELLPRLSILTGRRKAGRRSISVALFLGSPPAGVTRYPCPAEPGLSSQTGLSPRPRGCPAYLPDYDTGIFGNCQIFFRFSRINSPIFSVPTVSSPAFAMSAVRQPWASTASTACSMAAASSGSLKE